jgi:hypothetical protein
MTSKKKTPICTTCHKESVLSDAGVCFSIPFFYCRNCKIEVSEYGYPVVPQMKSDTLPLEAFELDLNLSGPREEKKNQRKEDEQYQHHGYYSCSKL